MRTGFGVLMAAALLVGCGGTGGDAARAGEASRAPAVEQAPAGQPGAPAQPSGEIVYVDVRTTGEYSQGHVSGALNIPVEEMDRRWQELEPYRDRQIVLYCRTGRRSGIAMEVLKSKGFTLLENGVNLDRMAARGLPVCGGGVPC
jgi:phage shock protein E